MCRPYFVACVERTIGPSWCGSPARTTCVPPAWISDPSGIMHSASTACPHSSTKTCVKWSGFRAADTNLQTQGNMRRVEQQAVCSYTKGVSKG